MSGLDYYELLGIAQNASMDDLRSAYRAAALAMHPDKSTTQHQVAAVERFQQLQDAWEVCVADMDVADCSSEGGTPCGTYYSHPCRCGSQHMVHESELPGGSTSLLVPCDGCSLVIRVHHAALP